MATNLRLRPATEVALRAESERSGRSQQELIRDAIDHYLGLAGASGGTSLADLVQHGLVRLPSEPLRRPHRRLTLPERVNSIDLLDRDDRV